MTASDSFVHLHVHTDYSMLDGAGKISSYVAEAARQEMSALAITDHGYMFGAYEFYNDQANYRRRSLYDPRHQSLR